MVTARSEILGGMSSIVDLVRARMPVMGLSVDQDSSERVCQELRGVLQAAVESEPGAAGGIESIQCRAGAALYQLLMDHPVDRRGRCRSCRRPGAVLALRRRLCRVHIKADYWLHQPAEFLHSLLAHELGLTDLPHAHARVTHAGHQGNPQTQPFSTRPSRPHSLPQVPRAGRPPTGSVNCQIGAARTLDGALDGD